jgi:hypothetical protein
MTIGAQNFVTVAAKSADDQIFRTDLSTLRREGMADISMSENGE